jgi:hypothetical protein
MGNFNFARVQELKKQREEKAKVLLKNAKGKLIKEFVPTLEEEVGLYPEYWKDGIRHSLKYKIVLEETKNPTEYPISIKNYSCKGHQSIYLFDGKSYINIWTNKQKMLPQYTPLREGHRYSGELIIEKGKIVMNLKKKLE